MSFETNKPAPGNLDDAEPLVGWAPTPILLIGLFALLVFWGFVYLENHGGEFNAQVYSPYANYAALDADQPPHVVDPKVLGMKVYNFRCAPCHQPNALGVPGQFPPLAGSEWVNAKGPSRILRAVLNGLAGPIKVKNESYGTAAMVPWKNDLSDDEIAAVLTFVRGNKDWGNDAPAVTAEQVKVIRDKIKSRDGTFSPDELLKLPENE